MFVHGFSDFPWTGWIVAIKDNYLELGDYNVFSINWNRLAHAPWYNIAATNSRLAKKISYCGKCFKKSLKIYTFRYVAEYAARWIRLLVSLGVRWEDIHVIGGSLGGQAAGHVGHAVGGKVGRITALDPSGPLFHSERRKDRLDDT